MTKTKGFFDETIEDVKERQQLCKDVEYLVKEDAAIREDIIDEYVWLLYKYEPKRLQEMYEFARKELEADW